MKTLLLGIDVGTSKLKVALYNMTGNLLRELSANVVCLSPARGCMEMDLDRLMADLMVTIRCLVGDDGPKVAGIGLSVSSPTVVLLDREGAAIRRGITYLDNRSIDDVARFVSDIGGEDAYFARIGNSPSPSTCSAGIINWLRHNEPDHWRRTWKVGFLNSFLLAQLTGRFAADRTTASYSGLLRLAQPADWDPALLRVAGLTAGILPEISASGSRAGDLSPEMAATTGLAAGTPVAIGSADTAASALALGLSCRGDAFHSMGTSEVLTFCLDQPVFSPSFMNRCHVIPSRWLAHGAMSTTGVAINWLRQSVFPEYPNDQQLEEAARQALPGAGGVIFLPYLSGERSPMFDPKASGGFLGVTLNTRREELVRSVYEGAAFGIKSIFDIASETWGLTLESVTCVGGAAKSSLAVQTRADVLGIPYQVIAIESAAAYGAALMGGMAAGVFHDLAKLPPLQAVIRTYQPQRENTALYQDLGKVYRELYPILKQAMHDLYRFKK